MAASSLVPDRCTFAAPGSRALIAPARTVIGKHSEKDEDEDHEHHEHHDPK
jgi:hypothetical protein